HVAGPMVAPRRGRIQLADEPPRLAPVFGQARADPVPGLILVAVRTDDRAGADPEELGIGRLERCRPEGAPGPALVRGPGLHALEGLVLAHDGEEAAVIEA